MIKMSGGSGTIWRDVATHFDQASGKTYAYVAAQGGGSPELYIVDLSPLSGSTAQGEDSNPIKSADYVTRGYAGYGHTVNVENGLLYLNYASSSKGCTILDLLEDPRNPILVATWKGSGLDCHDSFAKTVK